MSQAKSNALPTKPAVLSQVLETFYDPRLSKEGWDKLLATGATNTVNMTREWLSSWWKSFGKGRLLLILVEVDGEPVALAPLFTDGGMVYNLCPEDILDFIGDISEPFVLDAILDTARQEAGSFAGFVFYFIPDTSQTGRRLQETAERLGLSCMKTDHLPSPWIDIDADPVYALGLTRKKSLRRHENYFRRNGEVEVLHLQTADEILPHLDAFFQQHVERRAATEAPSIFQQDHQRNYYRRLTMEIAPTGWLRFTRINWNGKAIAFHFGLAYRGRYLYGIPSFDITLLDHSPGEVLLRHVLLAAIEEGAVVFDFGLGDEAYKYRFAKNAIDVYNWELYPLDAQHGKPVIS